MNRSLTTEFNPIIGSNPSRSTLAMNKTLQNLLLNSYRLRGLIDDLNERAAKKKPVKKAA